MEKQIFSKEIEEKFEIISQRMFSYKHCFELFMYSFQGNSYSESPVEIKAFGLILQEYFIKTKTLYNNLEKDLGVWK